MAVAGSPGWSETVVEGGRPFAGAVPRPPGVTRPFQNIAFANRGFGLTEPDTAPKPQYCADVAVVAFRLPEGDVPVSQQNPLVTSSSGKVHLNELTDGDVAKAAALPMAPVGENAWIQFEFAKPQTVRALTLVLPVSGGRMFGRPAGGSSQELEVSDDGVRFRTVAVMPAARMVSKTVAFEPITARYFRMSFKTPPPAPAGGFYGFGGGRAPAAPTAHQISELVLHTGARVNRAEEKAAFAAAPMNPTRPPLRLPRAARPWRRQPLSISLQRGAPAARWTGRHQPASGWCCAWAIRSSALRTTRPSPRRRGSRWTS